MELLSEYGLFLAKIVTVVLAIAAIAAIIVNVAQRNKRQRGELRVNNLSEQYKEMKEELAAALMDSHQQKQWHKAQKKKHKQEAKAAKAKAKLGEVATDSKPRVWVLDFKGSMDAHEVNSLREEITAVLAAFKPQDQGVVQMESPRGIEHDCRGGGSPYQRLRGKNNSFTHIRSGICIVFRKFNHVGISMLLAIQIGSVSYKCKHWISLCPDDLVSMKNFIYRDRHQFYI